MPFRSPFGDTTRPNLLWMKHTSRSLPYALSLGLRVVGKTRRGKLGRGLWGPFRVGGYSAFLPLPGLISGIIIVLINHYEAEAEAIIWRQQLSLHGTRTCACNSAVSCAQRDSLQDAQVQGQRGYVRRAGKAAEGVILDLQDLLRVGDVSSLVF
jgi:hypothetical protein